MKALSLLFIMDKSKYHRITKFRIFGKVVFEREEQYEGVDMEDIEPLTPLTLLDIDLNDQNKRN